MLALEEMKAIQHNQHNGFENEIICVNVSLDSRHRAPAAQVGVDAIEASKRAKQRNRVVE